MPYQFKRFLEKLSSEKAPGPLPSFSLFHMLHAIEVIAEKKIGRSKLAESLSVGEGAIRTILERLKDAGLIETSKVGCTLTSEGLKLLKECRKILKRAEIGKSELTLAEYNSAILIKKGGYKIKSGVEQRDAAVRVGAKGAITIIFRDGRLIIPSVSNNMAEDYPKATNQIVKRLKPEENDAIVIVSSDNIREAEYGTLAAAWTLLNDC